LRHFSRIGLAVTALLVLASGRAQALPMLQLYIEGSQYDSKTASWELTVNPGDSLRLWAIADVQSTIVKDKSTIVSQGVYGVRMSVSYDAAASPVSIALAGTQAGGTGVGSYQGISDPSKASDPTQNTVIGTSNGTVHGTEVTNGGRPLDGSGHAISASLFGSGTNWQEFSLGNFTLLDSNIRNFEGAFPTADASRGQINAYDVSVTVAHTTTLHFDIYGGYQINKSGKWQYVEAPLSHDAAETTGPLVTRISSVPEPASLVSAGGAALIGLAYLARRRARAA